MRASLVAPAFGAGYVLVALTLLVVAPAYGQSCTPSSEFGEAARSGAELVNEAGQTIVVSRDGERGLDATQSATNRGTVISCGEVHEYTRADGTPAGRRAHAVSVGSSSNGVTAVNSGLIETRGPGARGMYAWSNDEIANATATNRGRIVTRGDPYDGSMHFGYSYRRTSDGVLAEAGPHAGDATAVNERNSAGDPQSGVIDVHGTGARGLWVWTGGTGEAKGTNRGYITTRGDAFETLDGYVQSGAGIAAESGRGDATALNEQGATIHTHGDGAPGLFAVLHNYRPEDGRGLRTARAENHGTIVTHGTSLLGEDDGDDEGDIRIHGAVVARIEDARSQGRFQATVVNTGQVTAHGPNAVGLSAIDALDFDDFGFEEQSGATVDVTVRMTGGSVTAGSRDDLATPQDESGFGVGIFAESERGRAHVLVSGSSTTVTAYGASADDPDTSWNDTEGFGIWAYGSAPDTQAAMPVEPGGATVTPASGGASDTVVEVSSGATVTADIAVVAVGTLNLYESRLNGRVEFDYANNRFTVRGGSVYGDVDFDGLDDRLTIQDYGYIKGDVDFSEGTDTLVFDVNGTGERTSRIDGEISGIEEMQKRGPGRAWVRDVTFSGSALVLEEGGLTVAGHLNLGAKGTLTVHDESRLAIEVGDITRDATDHGLITAGRGVVYEGLEAQENPELFLQIGADAASNARAIQAQLQQDRTRIDVLGEGTQVLRRPNASTAPVAAAANLVRAGDGGATQNIGTLSSDGTALVELDEGQDLDTDDMRSDDTEDTARPRTADGGKDYAGALLIGGGAAALAVYLFDLFDSEDSALVESEESWTGRRTTTLFGGTGSGHYREHRVRTGALEQWTRAFADDVGGAAQGIAVGLDAKLSRGFHIGASMMPDMAVSAHRRPALHLGANARGGRYALRGGWNGNALFVDVDLSHGSFRTHSLFENPAADGLLGGELEFSRDHAQGRAGIRVDLGGIRATPSLSLFSGSLRQDAYTARGAALSAEVPGFSQRYAGWRAKLDLAPSGWLDGPGALSWRPGLHLGTTRTRTSGPGSLDVRQSDHEGVLGFASRAAVRGLPRTVYGFGASLVAARSDSWNLRMGYAGIVVDGEPVHAAVARLGIRF